MARPETISASDLTDRLAGVFRSKGYEGSSLSELSESAGLAKAALYHRFGDGKPAMAMAVLDAADARFERDVLAPLAATGSVESRLSAMVDGLARFYARGSNACLVELFSVAGTPDTLRGRVASGVAAWIEALAAALREAGFPAGIARSRAQDAVVRIQGALVLSRALSDTAPFARTLQSLTAALLATDEH